MEIDGVELNNRAENEATNRTVINLEPAKKLLYFSDGVMEELSDYEDECDATKDRTKDCVNVKNMEWPEYMRFKANKMGTKVLSGIDYVGGGLASFLGLTPSQADRLAAQLKATSFEDSMDEEHSASWNSARSNEVVTKQLKNSN